MKMKSKLACISITLAILISGCANQLSQNNPTTSTNIMDSEHSGSGELPKGLKEAKNPAYKVGSQVIILADHKPGMKGATAMVVGTYDTTAYSVSYTPTTGGARVTNHKWVIHEEIKNAGKEPFKPGTEVTLEADHKPGMKGATATIESAQQTTVYMVDYIPTTGGQPVKNHKWLIESELAPK